MYLNEACNKVRVGKHLSGLLPIGNGLKQGDALPPLLFNFALEYAIRILVFMDPCTVDDSVEIPTRCSFVI
jgi:hypothetical protein